MGIEEQFYLLFPVIIFLAWRLRLTTVSVILLSILAASLFASEIMLHRSPEEAFYWLQFRAWELLIGSILALPPVGSPQGRSVAGGAAILGLLLVAWPIFTYSDATSFPGLAAAPPCLGAALLLWAGRRANTVSSTIGNVPARYVGRISYSLYLAHWPVIVFIRDLYPDLGSWSHLALVIPLSFAVAIISYHLVERPTQNRGGSWTKRSISALTISGIAVLLGVSGVTVANSGFAGRQPPDVGALLNYQFDYVTAYREGTCFLRPEQSFAEIDTGLCLPERQNVALIWGDSFAAHYVPALDDFLDQRGFDMAQVTASLCPPIVGFESSQRPLCRGFNSDVLATILHHRPSLVLLSAYWLQVTDLAPIFDEIRELNEAGIAVVILGQSPYYKAPVTTYLAQRLLAGDNSTVSRDEVNPEVFAVDERMAAASRSARVPYVSVLRAFCVERSCPMVQAGVPIHWDNGHLTYLGADVLLEAVAPMLDRAIAAAFRSVGEAQGKDAPGSVRR